MIKWATLKILTFFLMFTSSWFILLICTQTDLCVQLSES